MSQLPAIRQTTKAVSTVAGTFAVPARAKERAALTPAPIPQPSDTTPRVVFALDATGSREASWHRAQKVQAEMFRAMSGKGRVQLARFGGGMFRASAWASDSMELADEMAAIRCDSGPTQIGAVLRHIHGETTRNRVSAAVFVGDTFEEDFHHVLADARKLGLLNVPVFVFHEIGREEAEAPLRAIASATGGGYARFPDGDPTQDLGPLLGAVAAFAQGGRKAMLAYGERSGNAAVRALGVQLKIEGPKS